MNLNRAHALALLVLIVPARAVGAQNAPPQPPGPPQITAALSSHSIVEVAIQGRFIGKVWYPMVTGTTGPAHIRIDYWQPHLRADLRGHSPIGGSEVPWDSVWRTGANMATHFSTDVDLKLGGTMVPAGVYTLYTIPGKNGWKLIINKQTNQFGTVYDKTRDLARVDMKTRTLAEALESFTIWIVPTAEKKDMGNGNVRNVSVNPARGILKLAWDKYEMSVDWEVVPPASPTS
jgi:hypothetical protein